MTKRAFLVLALLVATAIAISSSIHYRYGDNYVRDRTVRLESPEGSCTGTLVFSPINDKAYVLTAAHCEVLAFNNVILAETELGEKNFLTILKIDRDADLMVLTSPYKKGLYLDRNTRFHQDVRAIGWGMGERPFVSRGEILRVSMVVMLPDYGRLTRHLLTTVLLRPGNSGGPMVDDNNNLIGIDVVSYPGPQFSGIVAPEVIYDFFKDVK